MLRQAVKLSRSTSRAACRCYATHPTTSTTAAVPITALSRTCRTALRSIGHTSLLLPAIAAATTAPSMTMLSVVSCATVAPRRWSSFSDTEKNTGTPPLAPASLSEEEPPSTKPSVAEQISGLSAEDQERIIAALLQPEKEKSSVMGGAGIGPADGDMVAAFTCGPCDYRMVKRFSKHAYTKGIVIVECPNCRAKHLLADNLGWLEDEAKNIEDILREKGESFTRISGTPGDFQVVSKDETATVEGAAVAPPAAQG